MSVAMVPGQVAAIWGGKLDPHLTSRVEINCTRIKEEGK